MNTLKLRQEIKKAVDQLPQERLESLADYVQFLIRPPLPQRIKRAEKRSRRGGGWPGARSVAMFALHGIRNKGHRIAAPGSSDCSSTDGRLEGATFAMNATNFDNYLAEQLRIRRSLSDLKRPARRGTSLCRLRRCLRHSPRRRESRAHGARTGFPPARE